MTKPKLCLLVCTLLLCLIIAACDSESPLSAYPTNTPYPTFAPVSVTLDQAKNRAIQYNVVTPDYLPAGMKLVSVTQQDSTYQVRGQNSRTTTLIYSDSSTTITITEAPNDNGAVMFAALPIGENADATRVVDNFMLNSGKYHASLTAFIRNDVEDNLTLFMPLRDYVEITIEGHISREDIVKVAESLR